MEGVALLQVGAALVLNAGFAWLAGVLLARRWLLPFHCGVHDAAAPALRSSALAAALASLFATGASLWAAAALMGDTGLHEAWSILPGVAADTAYGRAGLLAMASMAALTALAAFNTAWRRPLAPACMLLVFALARASVSHAGEEGVPGIAYAIEVLHLLLVGAWLGAVAVGGWIVLPAALGRGLGLAAYLAALSGAAGAALAGIAASGLYNAWQRLDSVAQLAGTGWGMALVCKLALVAAAVLLGAYNRWWGFPLAARDGGRRAMLVLRLESLVLAAALAAAACLTVQPPPA